MRRRNVPFWIGSLLALAAVVMSGSVTDAALNGPPIDFTLSPRAVERGQTLTIRIAPMAHREWAGSGPLDVYLMWATTDRAAFLRPDGTWSPRPVALRLAMQSGAPPMVMNWEPHPPGDVPLALLAVPAGADPLLRSSWRFRPVLRSARVTNAPGGLAIDVATAAGLLGVTLAAIAVVAVVPFPHLNAACRALLAYLTHASQSR